ncbi:MAG: STAS domain-containing protein [Candidatus Hydrogenedentes bacterium]|nr:STAS domain-containing protein [Candidatus Hydrogenedentota bacterium]
MSTQPPINFVQEGSITVGTIATTSVLDALNVSAFGQCALEYVRDKPGLNLLLNFEHVTYLSSAVLSELIRINDAVTKGGGAVRLCALEENLQEVFKITNLDQVFVIYGPAKDAVKRYERSIKLNEQEESWQRFSKEE